MSGKSQTSLIILVMMAILIIFIWVFSLFWNQASQARTLASEKNSKLGKYLDMIKGLSRNYLILSSEMATKKVAKDVTTYYYNNPTPRTVDQIRYTLSKESLKLLNKYLSNTNFKEASFDYKINQYTCVDFPIDEKTLNSGDYDERFYVGSYGSSAEVSSEGNKVSSENNIFETITRDRFFLLYRKFVDWSKTANFYDDTAECLVHACICFYPKHQCLSGTKTCEECPEFYNCLTNLFDKEKNRLVTIIADPYVECSVKTTCCTYQVEDTSVDYPHDVWKPWDKAPSCKKMSGPEKSDLVCSKELSLSSQEEYDSENYNVIRFQEDVDSFLVCEQRVAYKATYTCIDKKYELSVPPEQRELEFNVDITTFVRRWCPKPE